LTTSFTIGGDGGADENGTLVGVAGGGLDAGVTAETLVDAGAGNRVLALAVFSGWDF
jgi:hypothetical protein